MWLIKLPFKILAGVAVFLLSFLITIGRLLGNVSSWLLSLLFAFIVGCAIYCVTQARWRDVGLLAGMALAVFLVIFLVEWVVLTAEQCRDALGNFIHS
ncbi:MAG: hypothetical protein LUG99_03135 [Lachnospiraceae bacterium]|nr:hypothetical protein [Lachnospiraceae bacterium]